MDLNASGLALSPLLSLSLSPSLSLSLSLALSSSDSIIHRARDCAWEDGLPADVYSFGVCLYELLHGVRFLGHLHQAHDVLLTVLNGGRPHAQLTAPQRAALNASDARFADVAALTIEHCLHLDWERRPVMADVTMCILLRRTSGLDERDWELLEEYTATTSAGSSAV